MCFKITFKYIKLGIKRSVFPQSKPMTTLAFFFYFPCVNKRKWTIFKYFLFSSLLSFIFYSFPHLSTILNQLATKIYLNDKLETKIINQLMKRGKKSKMNK